MLNSAYYGVTYTHNHILDRHGMVTGGMPLLLIGSWTNETGQTWYKFEIPNVIVAEPIEPIYLTARIGTSGIEPPM